MELELSSALEQKVQEYSRSRRLSLEEALAQLVEAGIRASAAGPLTSQEWAALSARVPSVREGHGLSDEECQAILETSGRIRQDGGGSAR